MKRQLFCIAAALVLFILLSQAASAQTEIRVIGPESVVRGEEVTFRADIGDQSSPDYVYRWEFHDGYVIYGPWATYAFNTTGEHDVVVEVLDEDREIIASKTFIVNVGPDQSGRFLAIIGAGLAVGISGMGAGIGVGIAGSSGAGALADKPKKFSRFLVFQALPQTQAIYGLLVAIFIFLNSGLIAGTDAEIPLSAGFLYVGAGLAVGIAGLSAIGQGISAAAGIGAYSRKKETFTRSLIFAVMSETFAIFGLLIAILAMLFTGFF